MDREGKWCEVRPRECDRKCEYCNLGLTKTNKSKKKHNSKNEND